MRASFSRIWSTVSDIQYINPAIKRQADQLASVQDKLINPQIAHLQKLTPSQPSDFYRRLNFNSQLIPGSSFRKTLIDGYSGLVIDRVNSGWSCHLITIVFAKLPGARSAIIHRMSDEVQRFYATLITRVHRKPRTASTDELPVLIGAIDLPVYKCNRMSGPKILCNDGVHFHALLLIPPISRLKESLADHLQANRDLYEGQVIQRIDVRPVVNEHANVVDYILKTILKGRLSYDEAMLVLPRTSRELENPS